MPDPRPCPECGVPEYITEEHEWLNNGDLVQARDHRHRMIFIESENLDPLFRNIEGIIGLPIDHIVMAAVRRAVLRYLLIFVPKELKKLIQKREVAYTMVTDVVRSVGLLMGYGRYELMDWRYEQDEDDYCIDRVSEPFSLPFASASQVATLEAVTDREQDVTCRQLSDRVFELTCFPSPHPEELKQRMLLDYYEHEDGDLELERCPVCGGPQALSSYRWYPKRGVILHRTTGRRMVIMGPQMLDPIFEELAEELGDTVPRVVVEAQRRFARTGFYTLRDVSDEWDFRTQLALRGLGNLKELKIRRRGLEMRLDNAVIPLMIVGMMQGVYEAAFDLDSSVDWELPGDGSLRIEASPKTRPVLQS